MKGVEGMSAKFPLLKIAFAGAALLLGEAARAQPTFRLGIEGESAIQADAGSAALRRYSLTLTHSGDAPGASAWCLGVRAANARITAIKVDAGIRAQITDGSAMAEVTTGPGNEGAVSCVTLGRETPGALPAGTTETIALIDVEFQVGADCGKARIFFADDLNGGALENTVDWARQTLRPQLGVKVVSLQPTGAGCRNANPDGWIRAGAWNMLLPLGNRYGCSGGGPANLLRNWVGPRDLTREAPLAGTEWPDLDFQGAALASGFEAANFYRALGLSGDPLWVSLAWLEAKTGAVGDGSCDPPGLDCDLVDFQEIIDRLNGLTPDLRIATIASDNVLAVAQTYVEYRGIGPRCLDVSTTSGDSIQVWVNDVLVASESDCQRVALDRERKSPAVLDPGINKITVLVWEGGGEWGFRLALADPETGIKLSNSNQEDLRFAGASPEGAIGGAVHPVVERLVENADGCPLGGAAVVTLKGRGLGIGTVKVTESYTAPGAMATITEISNQGILGISGGRPVVTWDIAAADLEGGISYKVNVEPGEIALPAGTVNDCEPIKGTLEVRGSLASDGPLGVFADSHAIGDRSQLAHGPGSLTAETGPDEVLGTADDLYTMKGAGEDIGDGGDGFHFAYQRLPGDFSVTVRIVSRTFPASGGRAGRYGLMARLDCTPFAKYSFVHANLEADPGPGADHPRGDAVFHQFRRSHRAGGPDSTASMGFVFPDPDGDGPEIENQPNFFRLVRRGRVLTGYASFDGRAWKLVGSDTWYSLAPGATLLAGFAYSKHASASNAGKVVFTDFRSEEPERIEIFDNDAGGAGTVIYSQDFSGVPDLSLPPGAVSSCQGCSAETFFPRVENGRLRISQEGVADTSAAVFFPVDVPARTGAVIIEYTAFARHSGIPSQPPSGNPDPGDGLTLAMVAGTRKDLLGAGGSGLGYDGMTRNFDLARPSFAVEADTWSSPAFFNEGTGAPENDGAWHLGINSGASVHCVALNSSGLPDIFSPDGVRHRVIYTSEGKVSVFLAAGGAGGGGGLGEGPPAAEGQVEPLGTGGEESASIGVTAATGGATQTSEIDDVVVIIIPCSDRSETARIAGPAEAPADTLVLIDATASDAGDGDGSEIPSLTFNWTVSGDGVIEGRSDGPQLVLRTGSPVGDGEAICRLAVDDRRCSQPAPAFGEHRVRVTAGAAVSWKTYDANDDGALNITDPVNHLNFLFGGGPAPSCQDAMDFTGEGARNITDPIAALNFLFAGGDPPARGVGCQAYPACSDGATCP